VGALKQNPRPRQRRFATIVWIAVALLAACGSDDGSASSQISVSDAWSLATATGQPNGAVYFTITSASADTLERVSVGDSIADHTEMHETVTNAAGEMAMHELTSGVALDPGTAVAFTPGGKHVMLVDLAQPLVAGQTFEITLEFRRADPVTLPVAVLEPAP
jgi:copper(I)-binding protein